MPPRKTTEQFIQDAIRVHGYLYNYSKVKYVNSYTKVEIICPEHGSWQCTPNSHTSQKSRCPKCAKIAQADQRRKPLEQFIADARNVHGDKYEYAKVVYVNNYTKVIITCPDHDDFEQIPNSHLNGRGCPECAGNIKKATASFITQAQAVHGNRYIYSKVEYKNNREEVIIICEIHGEFRQIPFNHLRGNGCKQCADEDLRWDTAQFIARSKEIHGDKFDYSLSKYVSSKTPIIIICNDCDFTFERTPVQHYRTKGCPKCIYKTESLLLEELEVHFPDIKYQYRPKWCKRVRSLPFDYTLVDKKIIIELDGPQHFKQVSNWASPEEGQQTDAFKTMAANKNGFSVIRLLQTDVKNNTYDWLSELLQNIKTIGEDGGVLNIFMCKHYEYEPVKEILLNSS